MAIILFRKQIRIAVCLMIALLVHTDRLCGQMKLPPTPPAIESMRQRIAYQDQQSYLRSDELVPSTNARTQAYPYPYPDSINSPPVVPLGDPNHDSFSDPNAPINDFVVGQAENFSTANPGLSSVSSTFTNPIESPGSHGAAIFGEDVWWLNQVNSHIGLAENPKTISLEQMILMTLRSSPRIQSVSQTPLIRETEIVQADAVFDPELFARTKYDDRTDPVGNILVAGNQPFLATNNWTAAAGLRRKLVSGGSIDVEQKLGHENNNSQFFDPQDQGTATLSLNFTQPLLRGAGKCYNRSQILMAELSAGIAWDTFSEELQSELLAAAEAYWNLYYQRAILLQKRRNMERGQAILDRLVARSDFDSIPSQIARARAAIQQRKTELANAVRNVKNAETEINRLTADPDWQNAGQIELVPQDMVAGVHQQHDLQKTVTTALENRPEIKEVMKRTRAAAVAADVSKNELLPELSLIFGAYVSGLEGDSRVFSAWREQFSNSTPGFYGGLEFSIPYHNRAAHSRNQQRRLQLVQIRHEVDRVVQDIIADASIALRRLESAYQTSQWAIEALIAAQQDLIQNEKRWEAFGLVDGDLLNGVTASTSLDQLLDAQQRLSVAELTYSQAMVDYKIAEVGLKKATGTLLMQENISINKVQADGLPTLDLSK